ncbi:MAG: hypothetical protein NTV38_08045 [Chloroflexi bacterium]|nr:hypothetical protein [Chloroflexota bacterium]
METGEVDQINEKPFNKEHQRKHRQCSTLKTASAACVVGGQHCDGVRSIHYIRREDAVVLRVETVQPARESTRDCEVEHELAGRVHAPKQSLLRTGVGIASPPPLRMGGSGSQRQFQSIPFGVKA